MLSAKAFFDVLLDQRKQKEQQIYPCSESPEPHHFIGILILFFSPLEIGEISKLSNIVLREIDTWKKLDDKEHKPHQEGLDLDHNVAVVSAYNGPHEEIVSDELLVSLVLDSGEVDSFVCVEEVTDQDGCVDEEEEEGSGGTALEATALEELIAKINSVLLFSISELSIILHRTRFNLLSNVVSAEK
jgi:hypothetical protein